MVRKLISGILLLFFTGVGTAFGQCAMCRATLENNLSNGDLEVGSTLNIGILYLFVTPYLALAVIAFFWYRHSKKVSNVKA